MYDNYLKSLAGDARAQVVAARSEPGQTSGREMIQDLDEIIDREIRDFRPDGEWVAPGVRLCAEGQKYLAVLSDPFLKTISNVGAPSGSSGPSLKARYFRKANMYIGTMGSGAVMFSPLGGLASSNDSCYATTASYTGEGGFPALNAAGLAQYPTNSDFTDAKHASAVSGRVVAAGVRIKPTGKLINKSGLVVSVLDSNGNGVDNRGTSDLLTNHWRSCNVHSVTDEEGWISAIWTPTAPTLGLLTSNAGSPAIIAANSSGSYVPIADISSLANVNLGIVVNGCEPAFGFYAEFFVWGEFFGDPSAGSPVSEEIQHYATPSYTDPETKMVARTSTAVAPNALQKNSDGGITKSATSSWWAQSASSISSLAKDAGKYLAKAGIDYASQKVGQKLLKSAASRMPSMLTEAEVSGGETAALASEESFGSVIIEEVPEVLALTL